MAVSLFLDEFTGTLPQETLDGGFRKTNPLADTYRFGGGKRGRQEGKQFGVPLVQHPDFHFRRYAAFHGTEVFLSSCQKGQSVIDLFRFCNNGREPLSG